MAEIEYQHPDPDIDTVNKAIQGPSCDSYDASRDVDLMLDGDNPVELMQVPARERGQA